MLKIVPAILTDNLDVFRSQIKQMENVTDLVQIDISDGLFTPSKTLGAEAVAGVATGLKYELHLMVRDPARAVEEWYILKNIKSVIFHYEAAKIPTAVIHQIKAYGFEAGLAVNPETPLADFESYIYQADKILFLSVTPGKQGQVFNESVLEKIKELKSKHPEAPVEIDGGVHEAELKKLKGVGIEEIVMGSEIFSSANPASRLQELQKLLLN